MRYLTVDAASRRSRGPEEIALDAWLEDAGPYVTLGEVFGSVEPSFPAAKPPARTAHRAAHAAPLALAPLTFD